MFMEWIKRCRQSMEWKGAGSDKDSDTHGRDKVTKQLLKRPTFFL